MTVLCNSKTTCLHMINEERDKSTIGDAESERA